MTVGRGSPFCSGRACRSVGLRFNAWPELDFPILKSVTRQPPRLTFQSGSQGECIDFTQGSSGPRVTVAFVKFQQEFLLVSLLLQARQEWHCHPHLGSSWGLEVPQSRGSACIPGTQPCTLPGPGQLQGAAGAAVPCLGGLRRLVTQILSLVSVHLGSSLSPP